MGWGGGWGGGRDNVKDCDINCLFLSLSVPRLVILTLYYNIKTLRTLSVNAKQRNFYHRQRHRFIIFYRQALVKHNLDTNSPTHLITSFQTTQSIISARVGLQVDLIVLLTPDLGTALRTQCEVWFPSIFKVVAVGYQNGKCCHLVVVLVTILNIRK